VVATLSTFADLARTIGGEHVEVSSIASPRFNPHFIEPKPSDVLKVKRAELFIHAGLDLELWRGPLLNAAGNTKAFPGADGELDLSRGIELLEVPTRSLSRLEGDIHLYGNPHYWTDPRNGEVIAQTICDKLCAVDPGHCPAYQRNLQAFRRRLASRIAAWRSQLAPYQGREVVGYHNEWPYLAEFAGIKIVQFLEPKPGLSPTTKHLQMVIEMMRAQRIKVILTSPYFDIRHAQFVAKNTGAKIALMAHQVGARPGTDDYLRLIDYNVRQLVSAFGEGRR